MANQQTIHYELASSADLRRLVADFPEIKAATIVVAFRESRGWQPTDLDIARLVANARSCGKVLIAEGGSRATNERAVLLGFRHSAVVSDVPSVNTQDTTVSRSNIGDASAVIASQDEFDSTANLATYKPASEPVTLAWHRSRKGTGDEPAALPPIARSVAPTTSSATGTIVQSPELTGRPFQSTSPDHPATTDSDPQPAERDGQPSGPIPNVASRTRGRRRRSGMLKLAAAVVAPILVIAVIAAMVVYTLPTAEITLVPREEPVASSLTYGIAAANSSFDIMIDPTSLSTTISAEATAEATGKLSEPAGTAGGTIQITNPLANDVTIPAGTEVVGPNGVTYFTAEDVRIPAADQSSAVAFGTGSVGVYAGITGPDGNLDAGTLTGNLGTHLFYTNPEAILGGRMDSYPVISEDDIASVEESVADELAERAREEFMSEIPSGMEIVPGTLEIGEPDVQVTAEAGDEAEEVSARGTITVRAKVYDPDVLHEQAGSEADRLLTRHARQAGADRILLAETVSKEEPTALDEDVPAYQIEVEAMTRQVITESEKEAIIEEITGLSRSEAEAVLASHPKVARHEISIEPDWLPDRMPEISSRISITVSSGEPTASTR